MGMMKGFYAYTLFELMIECLLEAIGVNGFIAAGALGYLILGIG